MYNICGKLIYENASEWTSPSLQNQRKSQTVGFCYFVRDLLFYIFFLCLSGDRIILNRNTTLFNQTAILASQQFNRSRDGHTKCLKFRYMLRGPGRKKLIIYQKTSNYREVPIWIWETKTGNNWIYGQVPLSAVSAFQVRQ